MTDPTPSTQRWIKVLTHFLCLCIIFILPEVLISRSAPGGGIPWYMYLKSVVYVAVFYINYYIIIDRCIGKRNWVLRLTAWNVLLVAASMVAVYLLVSAHYSLSPRRSIHHEPADVEFMRRLSFMLRDMAMVILTIGLSVAMKLSDYWMKLREQQKELLVARQNEELASLKNQLNPHFLFNTLNSIYALIALDATKAQKAVHELSSLLRYVLYENADTVPLPDELTFIDTYVKLMKLRLGSEMTVNVNLDAGDCTDCRIAPLLFISPVENAFKHGNTGRRGDSIDIDISASKGVVTCHIANRFITGEKEVHSGIGNVNLKRRLDLIYGDRASMTTTVEEDTYTVDLTIHL